MPSPRNHFALPTCSARSGARWRLSAQTSTLRHQLSQRRASGCALSRIEGRGGGGAGFSIRGSIGARRAGAAPGRARPKVTPLASPKSSRGISIPVVSLFAASIGGKNAGAALCERPEIPAHLRLIQRKSGYVRVWSMNPLAPETVWSSGFAGLVGTVALGTTAEVTLVPFMNAIAAEAGAG